jgi:Crinkler effector protein N-terminal domain
MTKLNLACYFPAETPSFVPINIDSHAYVKQLSEAIYEKLKTKDHDVQFKDLSLYKVCLLALLQASN